MRNVERAKKIATEKGINVSFVCREVGKSRGYISQMLVSGRDFPDEMLAPVANALGVTVEELTGEEQKEKPNTLDGIELEKLSPARRALLEALDGMDDENIMKIVRIAQAVKKELPE
jgi:transcriptional regulator with XRE-family HTH domain